MYLTGDTYDGTFVEGLRTGARDSFPHVAAQERASTSSRSSEIPTKVRYGTAGHGTSIGQASTRRTGSMASAR